MYPLLNHIASDDAENPLRQKCGSARFASRFAPPPRAPGFAF